MNYKFSKGDKVKIVRGGRGISSYDIGSFVTIDRIGTYRDGPGYSVTPKIGNCKTGEHYGMVGEESFVLSKRAETSSYEIY